MIEFRDVRKVYVTGRVPVAAVDEVTAEIAAGEMVAITGPSGSGKSTLLHLAAGLDTPSEGTVTVDGRDTRRMSDDELTLLRRDRIGIVFQFFNLIPTLSVIENVALPILLTGQTMRRIRPAVESAVERVGLMERAAHLPEELSGGEMQRVAIARALINNPAILLADEPTGNLDSATGREIMDLLKSLRQDRTIVMVTHDQTLAAEADRIIRIQDGRLV